MAFDPSTAKIKFDPNSARSINEDIPQISKADVRRLEEANLEQAEAERKTAQRRFEGSQDSVVENLLEGAGQIAAGGVGGVTGLLDFIIGAPARLATGSELTVNDILAGIDPRLDPRQQFVEEAPLREGLTTLGEGVTLAGGFVPVARAPEKVSSVLLDIAGVGSSSAPTLAATKEAVEQGRRLYTLETEEGVREYAEDLSIEFDVEQARQFPDKEKFYETEVKEFQRNVQAAEGKFDKISREIEEVEVLLKIADETEAPELTSKLQQLNDEATKILDEITNEPQAPKFENQPTARRAFVKERLRDAGVTEQEINNIVKKSSFQKPKPVQEILQWDRDAGADLFQLGKVDKIGVVSKLVRPVSSLVGKVAGPRVAAQFESAFETATRNNELFSAKYTNDEDSLSRLVDFGETYKADFLDLRTTGNDGLKKIMANAKRELDAKSFKLFAELVKDSKSHQKKAGALYREDVKQDEFFWASGRETDRVEEDILPEIETARRREAGAQERTRSLAENMRESTLEAYKNPIMEQINRINSEQNLIELAKRFRMPPSLALNSRSDDFFRVMQETIEKQTGDAAVAERVAKLANSTYLGTRSRPGALVETFMRQSYAGTLGQFDSAFLNLHDAAVSMVKNGMVPTLKAILQREGMKVEDLGIAGTNKSIGEFQGGFDRELKSKPEKIADWYQDKAFKYSGFRWMDRTGKGIVLRGSLNWMRSLAKTNRYADEVGQYMTNEELTRVRSALAKGTKIEDMSPSVREVVERVMFSRLGEQQLISAAGRPLAYLNSKNARAFWALSGFAIKQAELMKVGIVDNVARGQYGKAGEFAARYMIFAGLGYGMINQLRGTPQALFTGEDPITPEGVLLDAASQPVQVATFGRLGTEYANTKFSQDPVVFLMESVVPPAGAIGNVAKDVSRAVQDKDAKYYTLRSIPGGDELVALLRGE